MGYEMTKKELDAGVCFVYGVDDHEIKVIKTEFKFGSRYVVSLNNKMIGINSTFGPCRRKAMRFIRTHKMRLIKK